MRALLLALAVVAGAPPATGAEEASGPACVTDGDTIVVNGKRRGGRCTGGVPVRLFGIDAPALAQTCRHAGGRDFLCGRAAASFVLEVVKERAVLCAGKARNDAGFLIATCTVDGEDLGARVVREGWALADRMHSEAYLPEEDAAKAARRGLWAMQFTPPWEWQPK